MYGRFTRELLESQKYLLAARLPKVIRLFCTLALASPQRAPRHSFSQMRSQPRAPKLNYHWRSPQKKRDDKRNPARRTLLPAQVFVIFEVGYYIVDPSNGWLPLDKAAARDALLSNYLPTKSLPTPYPYTAAFQGAIPTAYQSPSFHWGGKPASHRAATCLELVLEHNRAYQGQASRSAEYGKKKYQFYQITRLQPERGAIGSSNCSSKGKGRDATRIDQCNAGNADAPRAGTITGCSSGD
ncbi:hypothetical protein IF1G_01424 [Cordyceps javanica]|uniref:Uncharacterized protein n=1 Tax=Cordyceps javanica TaxID=43265 RepID=A0A545VC77_9HYPO|nr:hypothetical protein IF1G_01424 [Cordyceps javanica]